MKALPIIIALIFFHSNTYGQASRKTTEIINALKISVEELNAYQIIGPAPYRNNDYYKLYLFTDTLIILVNKTGGRDGDYGVGESEVKYHFNTLKELYLLTEYSEGSNFEYGGRHSHSTEYKFSDTQNGSVFTDTVLFRYTSHSNNGRTNEVEQEEVTDTLRYQSLTNNAGKMKFRLPGYAKISQRP